MEQNQKLEDFSDNIVIIDKYKDKRGQDTTEFKECEGKLIIKQYSGINSDNFVIKKYNGKKINFSFFKLNGIYYVNINGEHIIDYKRFINIQQISKIEPTLENPIENAIKIKNGYIGDIIIYNCDPEIFQKTLSVMASYMKNKNSYMSDFIYFAFH